MVGKFVCRLWKKERKKKKGEKENAGKRTLQFGWEAEVRGDLVFGSNKRLWQRRFGGSVYQRHRSSQGRKRERKKNHHSTSSHQTEGGKSSKDFHTKVSLPVLYPEDGSLTCYDDCVH